MRLFKHYFFIPKYLLAQIVELSHSTSSRFKVKFQETASFMNLVLSPVYSPDAFFATSHTAHSIVYPFGSGGVLVEA
jgi:hypothetical protein